MFILIIVLLVLCIPCTFCALYLFYKHVLPRMRAAAAEKAAAKGAGDDDKDEEDEDDKAKELHDDMINSFLDPAWLQGMDDAPDLEINPVLRYKVDEEKWAAMRAAAEAAGEGGSTASGKGVPGAIARLGWALDESQNASKEEQKHKEKRRQMKNIEGWVARTYEADVTYSTANTNTLAGGVKFNALQMAQRTELERVGGRRQSALMMVAQKSRSQLANYMQMNPSNFKAYGVQPGGGE